MILRFLGLQTLLDRLFDDGWCLHLAPEPVGHLPTTIEPTDAP